MNDTNLTLNVVVTVLVILFVTLAMGQIIVFNLSKKTKKNLALHKVIACLGMGAAFYALFIAHFHFSGIGWMGLAGAVIGILFVGSMIQKYKKKRPWASQEKRARPPRRSVPKKRNRKERERGSLLRAENGSKSFSRFFGPCSSSVCYCGFSLAIDERTWISSSIIGHPSSIVWKTHAFNLQNRSGRNDQAGRILPACLGLFINCKRPGTKWSEFCECIRGKEIFDHLRGLPGERRQLPISSLGWVFQ